jgi:hypothetical protein
VRFAHQLIALHLPAFCSGFGVFPSPVRVSCCTTDRGYGDGYGDVGVVAVRGAVAAEGAGDYEDDEHGVQESEEEWSWLWRGGGKNGGDGRRGEGGTVCELRRAVGGVEGAVVDYAAAGGDTARHEQAGAGQGVEDAERRGRGVEVHSVVSCESDAQLLRARVERGGAEHRVLERRVDGVCGVPRDDTRLRWRELAGVFRDGCYDGHLVR